MCIAFVCRENVRLTEDELETAARTNRDGAGVAWPEMRDDEPQIIFEKGLDVDDVKELVSEVPHPHIVHFRKQSTGDATDNLTHPFPISPMASDELSGSAKRVLFHNGTASDWKDYYKSFIASRPVESVPSYGFEAMSDTRALAYMVYHATEIEGGSREAKLMAENMLQVFGGISRFAIMDAEDIFHPDRDGIRILGSWYYTRQIDNEEEAEAFVWDETDDDRIFEGGLLASNDSWRSHSTTQ